MSIKYGDNINLQGNQLINAVLHKMATAPLNPAEGQAWYDETNKALKIYNGTIWEEVGSELTVDPGSAGFVSITNGVLSFHNLAITDVTVDATYTDLAAFVAAEYTVGNEFQEGDMIILTSATDQQQRSFIHNGGSAGDVNDFTRLQTDIDTSTIRTAISGGRGIDYDSATGEIESKVDAQTITWNGSGMLTVKALGVDEGHIKDDAVTKEKINSDVAGTGLAQNVDGSLEVVSNDTLFTVGDGSTLTHTQAHSLGTKLFKAELIKESTGETIMCNFIRTTSDVQFYVNPPLATDDGKLILTKYNV